MYWKQWALMQISSAFLKRDIPNKIRDPESFTIPCSIEMIDLGHIVTDLRANINLMPLSIIKKLGIGVARPTTASLQLAKKSITYLEGKTEDILVQVDKFIFLADFTILDYEEAKEMPIILGRPFYA
ncbi:uncharacterized protein LOC120067445 [Benincasa hispida]|uniref:uncharacterized protein LOC120067445 n=1 Tax=Benincasa hispida TaxID=102211 RepID=UPI0019010120|nr:uncharacterized protein LOC120067445 [Benincasa hispida]